MLAQTTGSRKSLSLARTCGANLVRSYYTNQPRTSLLISYIHAESGRHAYAMDNDIDLAECAESKNTNFHRSQIKWTIGNRYLHYNISPTRRRNRPLLL